MRIRRAVRATLTLAAAAAFGAAHHAGPQVSQITGISPPGLARVDQIVADYMDLHGIKAGAVGIIRDGVIVYQRGFDTPENTMLRIASVEKPFTAAAIRILASPPWNFLDLNDWVFDLGQANPGILSIPVWGGVLGSPLLSVVTVDDLLQHEGGWDRNVSGDPMFRECEIASAMGLSGLPTREDTASFMLSQSLDNVPGTTYAYSNFGYMLLGLIVKELTGMEPITFLISNTVTMDDWVPSTEVYLGRSLKPGRSFRERGYFYSKEVKNVFDPDGPKVPEPDGGWHLEMMAGHGNLVMSTTPILRFLDKYTIIGSQIGAPHGGSPGNGMHTGRLHGTSSVASQGDDNVHIVVLYNKHALSTAHAQNTASTIRAWLDDLEDHEWPTAPVDGFWVDFNAPSSDWGAFDSPFSTMTEALDNTRDGTKLRFKPGSSGSWSGTLDERMRLDAPFGTALIGGS